MKYRRRILPPTLGRPQAPTMSKLKEYDDLWTAIGPKPRQPKATFPPARSDAEISAIVDEFIDQLCGGYY